MHADGSLKTLTREKDGDNLFWYYLLSFGTLGIVTKMTLAIVPEFMVLKSIFVNIGWDTLKSQEGLDKLFKAHPYTILIVDFEKYEVS